MAAALGPFLTSAPGKVIVFGEHAVVHGKAAIAAAIALRSYLLVTPEASPDARTITLVFPDIGLTHSWPVSSLPWAAFAANGARPVTALDESLVATLQPHLTTVSESLPDAQRQVHRGAATAFLYILLGVCGGAAPRPHTFTMRSTIPIAAGLGSSASISVCIAAASLLLNSKLTAPASNATPDERDAALELINGWAFVGELCLHGTPSGVDNTVATRGRAVLFRRMAAGQPPKVTPLLEFPVLPLLLVNTRQSRSTAVEVAKVRRLLELHPTVVNPILDAIDQITSTAHDLIVAAREPAGASTFLDRLGSLVRMNHGLLVALGVSHPRLERARELIDHSSLGYTKLTGAGGGGCAISLLTETAGPGLTELERKLKDEDFDKFETLLGGHGVGMLVSESHGRFPSIEGFLNARSSAEVEAAVSMSDAANGWAYWG